MARLRTLLVLCLLALAAAGCGADAWYFQSITSGAGGGSTLILVWLSDSPVDEATNLWVTIESVDWVGDTTTTRLLTGPRQVDLLALQAGVRDGIGQGEVPVEAVRSLRITFAPDGEGRHRIRTRGLEHALLFEGAATRVLDLPVTTTLVKDASVEVQVDMNARLSVVEAGGTYWLRPSATAFDLARAGFLSGRTVDAGAQPLAGAVVSAQQGGEEVASTRSLSNGQWKLGPLAPGAYELVAVLAARTPAGAGPLTLGAGVTLPAGDLVLGTSTPGGLSGAVANATTGLVVRLYGPLGFLTQVGVHPLTGAYSLPQLAPGTYRAELYGPEGLRATRSNLVVTASTTLSVDF